MHVFLTGASSGIGEALARVFAQRGARITLLARRGGVLGALAKSLNGEARVEACDVTDSDALEVAYARSEACFGPVDVLVNNAGVQILGPTGAIGPAEGEHLMRVNTLAPFRLMHLALKSMEPRGSGTIVNIASLAALAPTPGMFHYSASKAALAAASEALRAEVSRHGVHVLTVYPGPIETDMARRALARYGTNPLAWLPVGKADGLAQRILSATERREPRLVYPRAYAPLRHFPGWANAVMERLAPLPRAGEVTQGT